MESDNRGVSSAIATILMVAVVVILATTISASLFGFLNSLNQPTPNVAETTGNFVAGGDRDQQVVQITHVAGDRVAIEDIEIIVRVSGSGVDTEARLVNLPSTASSRLLDENIEGNDGLIDQRFGSAELIVDDGVGAWSAGGTIEFRINSGNADFREPPKSGNPDADELEIIIVHTPSNGILFEQTFVP